jgi:dual specificity protein kinase YAK1
VAFIDFVRGLLNINPLERWSPQQAKLHPFITQQKFTQPFVPPMNLKSPTSTKSPAPGVQQQQQAEAVSKQRAAQAAQAAQAQAQAHSAAQSAYAMQMSQYQHQQRNQAPPIYSNMYAGHQQGAPPPYPAQPATYGHPMGVPGSGQTQMHTSHYAPQQSLYAQATTRAGRQRASTMDQQQGGIPASIQRVASHLDPNAPIRLQPSPAYYPPPADGYVDSPGSSRRRPGGQRNRDFIRTLEDGAMGDGFTNKTQWH